MLYLVRGFKQVQSLERVFEEFSDTVREGFIKKVTNFGFPPNRGGVSTRPSKNQTANLNFPFSLKMHVFLQEPSIWIFLLGESKKIFFSSVHIHLMVLKGFFSFQIIDQTFSRGGSKKIG